MNKKADQVLVVTGGSRGIGAAVARLAAQRGYAVAVGFQANKDKATAVVGEIVSAGGRAAMFQADVGDPAAVERMFTDIESKLGRPTALVNSAGATGGVSSIIDMTPSLLQSVVGTNLFGTVYCIQAAARRMRRGAGGAGGAIVNVSSEAARFGGNRISAYAAGKAAVNTLTIAAARELAEEGIRVNAISPGVIDTDQHAGQSEERRGSLLASIPLKRMGTADEVATSILWLLSDEAAYITGSILSIHGGR